MGGRYHMLMVPWLAFGHLIPFLQLAKSLAGNGHRISFLTTPRNIARLIPSVPQPLSHLINFIQFHLPRLEHLPENAEATIDLPSDELRPYLRKAFDSMEQKLPDFIHRSGTPSPDLIIYDYAAYWVPPIAAEFGVPCAFFGLQNAATFAFFGPPAALLGGEGARTKPEDFTVKPDWIPFPSSIAYRSFEARELFGPGFLPDASGISESHRFGKSIQGCQIAIVRSCNELEPEWLKLLGELFEKPVVPVGLLPPPPAGSIEKESVPAIERWLDEQAPGSVVYAAFGSEVKLTAAQMGQIAAGLELSELPFLWAVNTAGSSVPCGLVERIEGSGRGRIVIGWVPQVEMLGHGSVGGFLTHGGWNSIVEGLALGRVMVVLPMMFDQGLNARNLVEKGVGVEVRRREEDGAFTGEGIAESLRLAMVEEGGETFRAKAAEYRDVFGDEDLHHGYVKQLIDTIRIVLG